MSRRTVWRGGGETPPRQTHQTSFSAGSTLMRNTRPLSRRSFRRASSALCLFALLVALTPGAPAPAAAKKKDARPPKAVRAAVAAAAPLQTGGAEVVGQWSGLEVLDTVPVHVSMLPDGRLLYWGRDKHPTD